MVMIMLHGDSKDYLDSLTSRPYRLWLSKIPLSGNQCLHISDECKFLLSAINSVSMGRNPWKNVSYYQFYITLIAVTSISS